MTDKYDRAENASLFPTALPPSENFGAFGFCFHLFHSVK
jgi:hypothetical protein